MQKVSVKTQSETRMNLLELVSIDLILFLMIFSSVAVLSCRVMNSCLFILDIHLPLYLHGMPSPESMQLFEIKRVIIYKALKLHSELQRD